MKAKGRLIYLCVDNSKQLQQHDQLSAPALWDDENGEAQSQEYIQLCGLEMPALEKKQQQISAIVQCIM